MIRKTNYRIEKDNGEEKDGEGKHDGIVRLFKSEKAVTEHVLKRYRLLRFIGQINIAMISGLVSLGLLWLWIQFVKLCNFLIEAGW